MGTAWREAKDGPQFDRILDMVRIVRDLGMEACVTLGMLTDEQAERLAEAGLTAYNHNLDTSRRHYPNVDHHAHLRRPPADAAAVQKAGIAVCCGGILGMGENEDDRLMLLARAGAPRAAARKHADQLPGADRRHAARRRCAGRFDRTGAPGRDDATSPSRRRAYASVRAAIE